MMCVRASGALKIVEKAMADGYPVILVNDGNRKSGSIKELTMCDLKILN